jgi:hypothetical protein
MNAFCGKCNGTLEFKTETPSEKDRAENPFVVVVFPDGDRVKCDLCGAVYKLELRSSAEGVYGVAGVLQPGS